MSASQYNRDAIPQRVAGRIRILRLARGLTQEKLAQRAGLAPRHIQKIEAGTLNVTIESLAKIAAALEVDISELFVVN